MEDHGPAAPLEPFPRWTGWTGRPGTGIHARQKLGDRNGGAYRSFRFRLDENGPIPNGIGEESLYPAYLRLSRALGPGMTISLYGGAALAGKLTLQNKRGHDIDEANYDAAPLISVSISGKF
jgi:hypothetical protein